MKIGGFAVLVVFVRGKGIWGKGQKLQGGGGGQSYIKGVGGWRR